MAQEAERYREKSQEVCKAVEKDLQIVSLSNICTSARVWLSHQGLLPLLSVPLTQSHTQMLLGNPGRGCGGGMEAAYILTNSQQVGL